MPLRDRNVMMGSKGCRSFPLAYSGAILTEDLTRFAIQAKGPDCKWTRKPLVYRESNNIDLRVTRPSAIRINPVLNIFTLLAVIQSIDNLFHLFIVNCEKEYFLLSNLHCSFTNFTSCPLVLLSFMSEKIIFLSICSYPFNILKTSI